MGMNRKVETIPANGRRSMFGGLASGPRDSGSRIKLPTNSLASDALPPDYCNSCRSRCVWTATWDAVPLVRRRDELHHELKACEGRDSTTVQSAVALSSLRGGDTKFNRKELINELSEEIELIDSKLLLTRIDSELHRTYANNDESITICSVHGYDVTVERRDGISILEQEHNKYIAQIASIEVIDDILEW